MKYRLLGVLFLLVLSGCGRTGGSVWGDGGKKLSVVILCDSSPGAPCDERSVSNVTTGVIPLLASREGVVRWFRLSDAGAVLVGKYVVPPPRQDQGAD